MGIKFRPAHHTSVLPTRKPDFYGNTPSFLIRIPPHHGFSMRLPIIILLILTVFTSCRVSLPPRTDSDPSTLDMPSAHHSQFFPAEYGELYAIKNSVIAKYPDFDVTLHREEQEDTPPTFMIMEQSGSYLYIKAPTDGERQHFYFKGKHYYYQMDEMKRLTIYVPSILMAVL